MTTAAEKGNRDDDQKLVKKIKNYIYDPGQIIGSGFSSNVYKGLNQLNGQTLAIKVLELNKIQSEVQKYLLNNEINALRALSDPHVLRTIQILMTKNNVYIMTEFCENGDLQQHVRKHNRLNQLQALHIIRDVAEGYLAIEQKKIVHRDLKTANIFLTGTGARIADFGFCQFLNETKKPQMFYNVGSPAYMSPESYRDNQYSAKSDIWSIGIILYEMLVGDTPDKTLSYSQMSTNLMAGRISCGNNEEIRKILAGCFKRDLKERWSPSQLLEAIQNELARQEPGKPIRSHTAHPSVVNSGQFRPSDNGPLPSSPSQMSAHRQGPNRQMKSSQLPNEHQTPARSQSPIKTRFVNQTNQRRQASPLNAMRREENSPRRGSAKFDSSKIKSITEMLLFLYRLLNFMGQTELQGVSFMRLILFRHRSHLQSSVQRQMTAEKLDRATYDPFKQFQYLKSRFDQAYLLKEAQPNSHGLPTKILSKLNQLSNHLFTDYKSILTYNGLIVDVCRQCQRKINSNSIDLNQKSKIGTFWDYLMMHFEILELYSQGHPVQRIVQEYISLTAVLRDQPRKLGPKHYDLLRHKYQAIQQFYEKWSAPERRSLHQIPERAFLQQNGFF